VHIAALRRKLGEDSAAPRYIHTVRGVGFRFVAAEEAKRQACGPACSLRWHTSCC
jgi:DNA-binding winged helix-turn-helix (wHTH) protein